MLIPDFRVFHSADTGSLLLSLLFFFICHSLFHSPTHPPLMTRSINTTDSIDDEEDRPVCTHQESSLGISQALKPSGTTSKRDSRVKTSLRDETLPEASETDNLFIWARFYISLYYNKVCMILHATILLQTDSMVSNRSWWAFLVV